MIQYLTIDTITNFVGIIGMICIVTGYFLVQTGKAKPQSLMFTNFNMMGAIFLTISLVYHMNISSFILEMFWIGISLYAYYQIFTKKKKI